MIDELQNIAYRKNGIRFINFLVQLINGAGVSICMVGTPRVLQVLQQEFRAARRTTGLIYDRLPDDKEFALLLHGLWHYQYTRFATDLTPEMQSCCIARHRHPGRACQAIVQCAKAVHFRRA